MKLRNKVLVGMIVVAVLSLGGYSYQKLSKRLKQQNLEKSLAEFLEAFTKMSLDQVVIEREALKHKVIAEDLDALGVYFSQVTQGRFGDKVDWIDLNNIILGLNAKGYAKAAWYLYLLYNIKGDETKGLNPFYDLAQAYEYLELSAKKGYDVAQFSLSKLYERDDLAQYGYNKDLVRAVLWQVIAEKSLHRLLINKTEGLMNDIGPFEVEVIVAKYADRLSVLEREQFYQLYTAYEKAYSVTGF